VIIDVSIIRGRGNNDIRAPKISSNPLLMPRNYPHTRLQLSVPRPPGMVELRQEVRAASDGKKRKRKSKRERERERERRSDRLS